MGERGRQTDGRRTQGRASTWAGGQAGKKVMAQPADKRRTDALDAGAAIDEPSLCDDPDITPQKQAASVVSEGSGNNSQHVTRVAGTYHGERGGAETSDDTDTGSSRGEVLPL